MRALKPRRSAARTGIDNGLSFFLFTLILGSYFFLGEFLFIEISVLLFFAAEKERREKVFRMALGKWDTSELPLTFRFRFPW